MKDLGFINKLGIFTFCLFEFHGHFFIGLNILSYENFSEGTVSDLAAEFESSCDSYLDDAHILGLP